ncbi:Interferon-induced very large GTPase 1 [Dissostichus eleginoides]|uniref:Interferon-induced very large GTPase 1 n=1 Tax=Dissostichus eleginoides TaxID=100907 RepID=A0AAD9F5V4_DISEL|nr:Interferon-induced very large GTPase 1 [Dissostichus eleginoides]
MAESVSAMDSSDEEEYYDVSNPFPDPCCEEGKNTPAAPESEHVPPPGEVTVLDSDQETVSLGFPPTENSAGFRLQLDYSCETHSGSLTVDDSSPVKVDGLIPGTEYTFSITRIADDGNPSKATSLSVFTEPSPPVQITVDQVSSESLSLHWDTPAEVSTKLRNGRISSPTVTSANTNVPPPGEVTVLDSDQETVSLGFPPTENSAGFRLQLDYSCETHSGSLTVDDSSPVKVDGLIPGTEYTFSITRIADNGNQSKATSLSVFTEPSPPVQITVDQVSSESLSLHWDPPAGEVESYIVTCCSEGDIMKETTDTNKMTFSNLKPGECYFLEVSTKLRNGRISRPTVTSANTKTHLESFLEELGLDHHYKEKLPLITLLRIEEKTITDEPAKCNSDLPWYFLKKLMMVNTSAAVFVFFDALDSECELLTNQNHKAQIFLVGNRQNQSFSVDSVKKVKMGIEKMSDIAHELGIWVDEDSPECQNGKKNADAITAQIQDILKYKEVQLPLQGQIWKDLTRLEKEEFRLRKVGEQYKEKCKNSENKEEIKKIDQQLSNSSLGTEHFFREMGQIYEASRSLPETDPARQQLQHLPKLCAELMLAGFPLELVDGEASNIPIGWVTDVLSQLNDLVSPKNKILVVTVLGVQSTGKSTLLNTMFGVQFAVSSGRCTRGAFLLLIKINEDVRKDLNCDFMVIIDTEGLKSPELAQLDQSHEHDNELATLVVGLSDITIINVAMENSTEMKDILQIVVHAFLRMKEVSKKKPKCQFVHQNVSDVSAHDKNLRDRKLLLQQLNEMTQAAAKMEKKEEYSSFTDVMEYSPDTGNWYIPGLWNGNPPMAPVNAGYSEAVYELKKNIIHILGSCGSSANNILEFTEWMKSLWTAVKHENFIFSFRNSLVADAYMRLCKEFNRWEWDFKKEMYTWVTKAETVISNFDVFHNVDQCQKKAEEFTDRCLKPAVEDYVNRSLGPDIIGEMRTSEQFSTRMSFQYSVLLDLLPKGDFKKYQSYICSYEKYVKKWILNKIVQHFSNGSTMFEDPHLQSCVNSINNAIQKAKTEKSGNLKSFVEVVCKELGDKLVISQDALGAFMILNKADQEQFAHWLTECVTEMAQTLREKFKKTDIQTKLQSLHVNPQNELFNTLIGCGKQCPFCKAPCEAGARAHTEHFASLHRPQGLGLKMINRTLTSVTKKSIRTGKSHQMQASRHQTTGNMYWQSSMMSLQQNTMQSLLIFLQLGKEIPPEQAEASLKESFHIK